METAASSKQTWQQKGAWKNMLLLNKQALRTRTVDIVTRGSLSAAGHQWRRPWHSCCHVHSPAELHICRVNNRPHGGVPCPAANLQLNDCTAVQTATCLRCKPLPPALHAQPRCMQQLLQRCRHSPHPSSSAPPGHGGEDLDHRLEGLGQLRGVACHAAHGGRCC